jgi:hypothetical protein
MSIYLCHEQPDLLAFETEVVDSRPGAVVLARSAPIRIVKIENKGRHNRRVRIELVGEPA